MSIRQIQKVFTDTNLKGNEKLLMLALADNCNDSGVSFPSWNSLMTKTSMSRGSISKWFNELEKKGLLFRVSRNRKNGSRTSNKYLIYPFDNKSALDDEELEAFSDAFNQSSGVEPVQELNYHSSESELPTWGQSSGVEHLEPSLILNHQSNRHLCGQIINNLNCVLNKNYKATTGSTIKLIEAKLKQGFTVEDFEKVHIVKFAEWNGTDYQKYLRPETLYGAKFETYLNQELSDYDKAKAICKAQGITMSELMNQGILK